MGCIDRLSDFGRTFHRLSAYLKDHVALFEALVRRGAVRIDLGHNHAVVAALKR